MFNWILNMRLKGVLQNSCYQRGFTKTSNDTFEENLINFTFSVKVK